MEIILYAWICARPREKKGKIIIKTQKRSLFQSFTAQFEMHRQKSAQVEESNEETIAAISEKWPKAFCNLTEIHFSLKRSFGLHTN